jgi:cytochrome c2
MTRQRRFRRLVEPAGALASRCACTLAIAASVALAGATRDNDVSRGKYLVEEVAMCQECHTPRDASGALDPKQWLKGGPVFLQPAIPVSDWAARAPSLAGLTGWTDADFLYFMENGKRRTGEVPKAPMKRYNVSPEDAAAILSYLRSLAAPAAEDEPRRIDAVPPAPSDVPRER